MKIQKFLQDGNGEFSATRLGFLLWVVGVLMVWIYMAASRPDYNLHIDTSVITLIGILMTGKVVQSFSPNDGPASGSPQPATSENKPAVATTPAVGLVPPASS